MKTHWFHRYKKEVESLSPYFKFKYLKMGFWRVYWKDHYFSECFEEMPPLGHNIEAYDPRLSSQKYYEEFEDHVETVRTIKNFKEGYYDGIQSAKRRFYQLMHQPEFFERSKNAYKNMMVK